MHACFLSTEPPPNETTSGIQPVTYKRTPLYLRFKLARISILIFFFGRSAAYIYFSTSAPARCSASVIDCRIQVFLSLSLSLFA